MLLFKVYPSTQSTLNQVRGIQETNCLTEHASPNLDLPSTLPTISPLLTHCSKTSSDRDICKKEVRTAIAHCRAKAEAKRKRHCMSDIKGQRRSLWDRLRHKEHSKRRRATQAEDAVAPGTQPTLTATQAEGSMASGDVVAHFLPAADHLSGA